MTPTKLLIGQILIVFAIVIAGLWAATQWAAAMLAYQPQLGAPWFLMFGVPVYRPWQLFPWWYSYDAYARQVFNRAGLLAGTSGFMGCAAAVIGSLWRARQGRLATTYGSSRWATAHEIEAAGLFRAAGVFLGRLGDHYLRHDGPEHVMAFAPTRSGKGVGLADILDGESLGKEAKAKTRTKLNALCMQPREELADFIDRGITIFKNHENPKSVAVFAWGAALAAYPFFGKVAEFTGRLTSIQGDCSTAEIHRRISESYGDREVTKRAAQAVLQTQAHWGAIQRTDNGKRLTRLPKTELRAQNETAWLVEACVLYAGRPLSVLSVDANPILYPFDMGNSLGYTISGSTNLELRSEGINSHVVDLRTRP